MRQLALALIVLSLGCSDDSAGDPLDAGSPDAATRDAALDATLLDANISRPLDAGVDTECFSPLRPPRGDASLPRGCACDFKVEREPYCLGALSGRSPFLLACTGLTWTEGRDGNCAPGSSDLGSCTERGYVDAPAGGCGRGYAPVAATFRPDGGVLNPACCQSITVSGAECRAGGFDHQALWLQADGGLPCKDGRPPLAWIAAFEPEGCCEL